MERTVNGVKVTDDSVLCYVANPKKVGSKAHARYEVYCECETLGDYLKVAEKKYALPDLRWDHDKGFLTFDE